MRSIEEPVMTDWGAPARPSPLAIPVVSLAVAILAGIAVSIVANAWGGALAAVVVAAIVAGWHRLQHRLLVDRFRPRPLQPHEYPRFSNLVRGLASDLGVGMPSLWVIDNGGANALVFRRRGGAIAITKQLLETFTRTELEAVIAHCLVRLRDRGARRAASWTAFGRFASQGASVGFGDDVAAAAVTRYPTGLASALEKSAPAVGWGAAFWFAAVDRSHAPLDRRVAALKEL
jgi:hypothetical protein